MESQCNTGSLKYRPRLGYYKINTGNCRLDILNGDFDATSYGHWQFAAVIDGALVFNGYHYSTSTSGHQYEVRRVLTKELGQTIDLTVHSRNAVTTKADLRTLLKELYSTDYENKAYRELRKRTRDGWNSHDTVDSEQIERIEAFGIQLTKREHRELKYAAEFSEIERECGILDGLRHTLKLNKEYPNNDRSHSLQHAKNDLLDASFVNV